MESSRSPGKPARASRLYHPLHLLGAELTHRAERGWWRCRQHPHWGRVPATTAWHPRAAPSARCSLSQPYCWGIPMLGFAGLLYFYTDARKKKRLEPSVRFLGHPWHFPLLPSAFHVFRSHLGSEGGKEMLWWTGQRELSETPSHQHCNLWKISSNKDRLFIFLCAQFGSPRVSRGYL